MGILLFDMLTGSPPWTDKNEKALCEMITSAKLVLPVFLSDSCKSLLKAQTLSRDLVFLLNLVLLGRGCCSATRPSGST